ncbi:MAG: HAMP domain-containing protein [Nitrospirae bacterium]|nr:HAMP domain-containing protein [Nitrospirota bacterium]
MKEMVLGWVRRVDGLFNFKSLNQRVIVTLVGNFALVMAAILVIALWVQGKFSLEQELNAAKMTGTAVTEGLIQLMEADEGERAGSIVKHLLESTTIAELRIIHAEVLNEDEDVPHGPEKQPKNDIEREALSSGAPQTMVVKNGRGNMFDYVVPIVARGSCGECHDVKKGEVMGAVSMSFSLKHLATLRKRFAAFVGSGAALGAVMLSMVLALVFTVTISQPVQKVTRVLDDLAGGKLNQEPLEVKLRDEIAAMRRSFNQVLGVLGELARQTETLSKGDFSRTDGALPGDIGRLFTTMQTNLRGLLAHVDETVRKTESAAAEIKAVSGRTIGTVQEHQARIEDVAAAVTQLATAVQEVATNSGHADTRMKEITELARRSKDVMTEGLRGLEATEMAVRDAVQDMTQLNQNCRRVGEIVKTIEGIAAQTNMLALNAAIEAARAGEAGSGFAVVADEVRKLAEKAASEAGNITSIIENIGEGANKTLAAVERTSKVTNETATLTVQAGKALDEILSGTAQASKLSAEIRVATDQQAKASDEVAGALTSISKLVQESAAAFQQLNTEAGTLSALGSELMQRMSRFKL